MIEYVYLFHLFCWRRLICIHCIWLNTCLHPVTIVFATITRRQDSYNTEQVLKGKVIQNSNTMYHYEHTPIGLMGACRTNTLMIVIIFCVCLQRQQLFSMNNKTGAHSISVLVHNMLRCGMSGTCPVLPDSQNRIYLLNQPECTSIRNLVSEIIVDKLGRHI